MRCWGVNSKSDGGLGTLFVLTKTRHTLVFGGLGSSAMMCVL